MGRAPSLEFRSTVFPIIAHVIEAITQHPDQDRLVIERPESTDAMAGSTCNPETTFSGALDGVPDRLAAERLPPYVTETNGSSEKSKATCAVAAVEPLVEFVDFHGRKFRLPVEDCRCIHSTRTLVAREIKLEDDSFEFWIGEFLITERMWASQVNPGAVIVLRTSVTSGSSLFLPPPPPPPPPTPQTSKTPPISAPLLKYSEIWNAEGPHTLPFSGCGDRIFSFFGHSIPASLESLNLYRKLRERAPPERWSDLHGNAVLCGRATALDRPQVNIGPVLAGRLSELQGIGGCSYVLVRKAELIRSFRDKDASAHLDGDSIYQWVSYLSLEHAQAGLVESLGLGYSIVGNWAELNISKTITVKWAHLVSKKMVVEEGKINAVVDALSFTGWQRLQHLVCGISS
ncbi:hypothetical protein CC78DRAFT_621668 [Lojkania enalia]|uniref:Uncharacterized protein n=1 Tax=Lojkania enalia TaxID=147567 RepID=A0A9P4N1D6_9PLEO|nr:hypothetical protein CC78DRAFT_621668 [Didymosphaeria enalia]